MVNFFWLITFFCVAVGLVFIIPPLWLHADTQHVKSTRYSLTIASILLLPLLAYGIYWKLGASDQLATYYSVTARQARQNNRQMRPLYARLQAELLKSRLDLKLDPLNVELILDFATVHAKLSEGILQPEIKELLEGVLKAWPLQITALNLLAVHAYNRNEFAQAIAYWQQILAQLTPEVRAENAARILQDRIAATRLKLTAATTQKNF